MLVFKKMLASYYGTEGALLSKSIRPQWGIENSLHSTMDVTCNEDRHRLIDRYAVCNLSATRRLAVTILRQDEKTKLGVKNKRFKSAMDPSCILDVLANLEI